MQDKFNAKLSNIFKEAVKKFATGDLKLLIDTDIPYIQSFLEHPSFRTYILQQSHNQLKSLITDPLKQVIDYSLLFIAKQMLSPREPLDIMDPELIEARKKLPIQVSNVKQALKVIGSIFET